MSTLQNLKDGFYLALRDRLAALNPERTTLLRAAVRPAVVTAENEIAFADASLLGCFLLHWGEFSIDTTEALPLLRARCTVSYSSEGLAELAGMNRGRTLAAMDAELATMLAPHFTAQRNLDGAATLTLLTQVFWSEPTFAAANSTADRLTRSASVDVFAWKEPA